MATEQQIRDEIARWHDDVPLHVYLKTIHTWNITDEIAEELARLNPDNPVKLYLPFINDNITFLAGGPDITSVVPSHALPGETVVVNGSGFIDVTDVTISGVSCVGETISENELHIVVPETVVGTTTLVVTTALGSDSIAFEVDGTGSSVAAWLLTDFGGSNNDLRFTAVVPGENGNSITIEFALPETDNETTDISVSETAITITLAGTVDPQITTTTADDIRAVIADSLDAFGLVTVQNGPENDGSGFVGAMEATNLENGSGPDVDNFWLTYLNDRGQSFAESDLTDDLTARENWPLETRGAVISQPVVYGDLVFVGDTDGYVYAFSISTGQKVWETLLSDAAGGITGTVLIHDNMVYIGAGGDNVTDQSKVYGLNALTGEIVWDTNVSAPPGNHIYSSPAYALIPETEIVFGVVTIGAGNSGLIFTSKIEPPDDTDTTIEYIDAEITTPSTTAEVIGGTAIQVTLERTASVQSSVTTALGSNKDVKATAGSNYPGADGDNINLQIVADDDGDVESLNPGQDFALTNNTGGPTEFIHLRAKTGKTVAELVTWAGTNPLILAGDHVGDPLHNFMTVALALGSDGSGLVSNYGGTQLSGGTDGNITATASDVKDAIEADTAANDLVSVALLGDGTGLVGATEATAMNSGTPAHDDQPSIFIGVSSVDDGPLIQGLLVRLHADTGDILATFKVVPDGSTGGGIWGSPTIDGTLVYVATGNEGSGPGQEKTISMVKLNGDTLVALDWWKNTSVIGLDEDFGSTPTLFGDFVGVGSKDGNYYVFDLDDPISEGPSTTIDAGKGGPGPFSNACILAPASYNGTYLFIAGPDEVGDDGHVRAYNPSNLGTIVWESPVAGFTFAPVISTENLVIVAAKGLYVFDAATGDQLALLDEDEQSFGGASIFNGMIFVGSVGSDHLRAFSHGA